MYKDKGISVEAYLGWSGMTVLQVEIMCGHHEFSLV